MYCLITFLFQTLPLVTFSETVVHKNPSHRTEPQDILVTYYHCEENEQKTLHKHAINQVTQCISESREIETTNILAKLYSKARATTLTVYKFTATFSEKKVHCSQVSNGNKNPSNISKNTGRTGGKLRSQDKSSTRLQELSLIKKSILMQFTMTFT